MRANKESFFFPAHYIELVESLLRARQGDVEQIARRCKLAPEDLHRADLLLSLDQFQALMHLGLEHLTTGEPRFVQVLRHLPVTAHGLIGMACMTADTLGDALNVALRYFPLVMPVLELHRENVGNEVHVTLRRRHDLGSPLNELLIELTVGSLSRMAEFASGSHLRLDGQVQRFDIEVRLTRDGVENADAYAAYFGKPVVFGAPENKFIVARNVLSQPLLTRNRSTRRALEVTLDRQLQVRPQQSPTTQRARLLLVQGLARGQLLDATQIACELALSVRTLRRHLSEEGTSLAALTESVRMERAEILLCGSDLSLLRIAQQLGFSALPTFSRAFKRVTGRTPGELRRPGIDRAH